MHLRTRGQWSTLGTLVVLGAVGACQPGSIGSRGGGEDAGGGRTDAGADVDVDGDAGSGRPSMDAGVVDGVIDGGAGEPDASVEGDGGTDAATDPAPVVPGCGRAHSPGRTSLSFDVGGVQRQVVIYVPQGYTGEALLPLTFNLHGTTGNPAGQLDYSGIEPVADAKGFIVAALAGYEGRWNVARSPDAPDDVAFAEVVLDWAHENLCVDPRRIFSTGYSGGGRTSSRFACAMPDRIRAIAPVAGVRHDPPCDVHGMPVLTLHGTNDQTNYYGGCDAADTGCSRNGEWVESVEAAVGDWRNANGCAESATVDAISGTVARFTWSDCTTGAPVIFYRVTDGTHVWPLLPNTTEVVLDFFASLPPR